MFSCGNEKAQKTAETKEVTETIEQAENIANDSKTILCFGDSITAGYGIGR